MLDELDATTREILFKDFENIILENSQNISLKLASSFIQTMYLDGSADLIEVLDRIIG